MLSSDSGKNFKFPRIFLVLIISRMCTMYNWHTCSRHTRLSAHKIIIIWKVQSAELCNDLDSLLICTLHVYVLKYKWTCHVQFRPLSCRPHTELSFVFTYIYVWMFDGSMFIVCVQFAYINKNRFVWELFH